ncbi:MAG: rRNA maturation RNase YbeY [Alphaproteobacteria bacterium]|nr:rRNA maturation RNase YbeY [Alphaproteobacteria bacterium]
MSKKTLLDISVEHKGWRRIPRLNARLEKAAQVTLAHLPATKRISCSVSLLLTGGAAVRQLNRDFRGIDKPTNVLSFPQFEGGKWPRKGKIQQLLPVGDIVMGYQYIVAESKRDHKMLINHATHLLIHGLLHLFGYHHSSESAATRMERLETKIMKELGLPDPYAFPASAPGKK